MRTGIDYSKPEGPKRTTGRSTIDHRLRPLKMAARAILATVKAPPASATPTVPRIFVSVQRFLDAEKSGVTYDNPLTTRQDGAGQLIDRYRREE
jgi:hypothetical protein